MSHQELIVLRHGLRLDEVQPSWTNQAEQPWDPPLALKGVCQVLYTGLAPLRQFFCDNYSILFSCLAAMSSWPTRLTHVFFCVPSRPEQQVLHYMSEASSRL